MLEPLRWGILGTGKIANRFADELRQAQAGVLAATGSRTLDSASSFAAQYGGQAHGSYEQLLADPTVEAVYISLPNALHYPWTLLALQAGKHVLCEKPMAAKASEAEEMFEAADKAGLRLAEAFMYRHHPAVGQMLRTAHEGAVGQIRLIRANFTFHRQATLEDGRYQTKLAGGSLMDVGCYCVNFSRAVAQAEPSEVHAAAHRHESGVDDYAAGVLNFNGQILASFTCGMTVESNRQTLIAGDEGYLMMPDPWQGDGSYSLFRGEEEQKFCVPSDRGRFALEADEMAHLVREGGEQIVTPADTLGNLQVLDDLRSDAGLGY
ncbi:Gfo/Idh/MocA family protein [Lignipirellula cremea]|uniref:1,5-anhydro-D-fructose reductase n=1 Tax=Lignipirellula cremea TaxID=2528010 RepID=A0A518DQX9_9BACT|nr:Gfo/Idh/MocA family oxidoreductase [Lignipirellula cremea]QDU94222.1 1,5-anhydro-D-fructose reductase [Lignipirellula cremea]